MNLKYFKRYLADQHEINSVTSILLSNNLLNMDPPLRDTKKMVYEATNHFKQWCAYSDLWVHSFLCERCIILSTPRLSRAVVSAYNIFIWTFLKGFKWVTLENNARNLKWFTLFNLANIIMIFVKELICTLFYYVKLKIVN